MTLSERLRKWKEIYYGVLIGIVGNAWVEAFFGLVESFDVTIPPMVWTIEILCASIGRAYLLVKIWKYI